MHTVPRSLLVEAMPARPEEGGARQIRVRAVEPLAVGHGLEASVILLGPVNKNAVQMPCCRVDDSAKRAAAHLGADVAPASCLLHLHVRYRMSHDS